MLRLSLLTCSAFILQIASSPVLSAGFFARVNDASGLPEVVYGGKQIVEAQYVYFGFDENDKWLPAVQSNRFQVLSDYNYLVSGTNEKFGYLVENRISRNGDSALDYRYEFHMSRSIPRVIGGGIEFKLDPEHNRILGKPRLLPGRKGWIWGSDTGDHFKFEFENTLKKVYFEKGNANNIRAFFFLDSIDKSIQKFNAKFSFSSDVKLTITSSERFGPADIDSWFQVDAPDFVPVDLSFLNHRPAGRHGFLKTDGEDLVFSNGSRARFWGTNIAARALFETPLNEIPKQARRLAALGFNLVRIHHHDSYWVIPNVFGKRSPTTSELDDHYMTFIDKWIAELNELGIYVWFDLHVQRYVTAKDGITAFNEIESQKPGRKGSADIKGYSYVNPSIQKAMESINRQFMTRVNKFTGQRYAENPGIAALLLTNENDVTQHFANRLLPPRNVSYHTESYLAEARDFSERWDLPYEKVWRSWEPGISKIFLNDLEYRFNRRLIQSLREYDPNHLVATTSTWGKNPLYSLPALSSGDIIDVHSYGETGALEKNPEITTNFTHWIAAAQVAGKPVSVSEWNVAKFPVADRHLSPILMGAMAAHQGWDAIMQFGYATQRPQRKGRAFNYSMYNDPAFLGMMPAAALMYRMKHVQEANQIFVFAPTKESLISRKISPKTSVAIRTIPEKGKLLIALPEIKELPWLVPTSPEGETTVITNPEQSFIPSQATYAITDTGELKRDWSRGIYSVNTPKTRYVGGWIGGEVVELGDLEIEIDTRNASIAVQSMDDKPVESSEIIMISLAARAMPGTVNKAPIFAEPVTGKLRIRATPGLKLVAMENSGESRELPLSYDQGVYTIELSKNLRSYWLSLRKYP